MFPLIDLHCHLEGAITGDDLISALRAVTTTTPSPSPAQLVLPPGRWPLSTWGEVFDARRRCFATLDLIEALTREVVTRFRAAGGRHLELRFNPVAMATEGRLDVDEVLSRVVAGAKPPEGMSTALIAVISRHRAEAEATAVTELACRNAGAGVDGLDLAGVEAGHPANRFASHFQRAREAGLRTTAHAGEETGPESVRLALDILQPDRIGHGVACILDPHLVDDLRRRAIPLELCPISNYRTGCVSSTDPHPAATLLDAGVAVTINSDDPGLFGTNLTDDLHVVMEQAGLSDEQLTRIVTNAVDAAFLDEPARQVLQARARKDLADAATQPGGIADLLLDASHRSRTRPPCR